ncbi:MAG: LptF/LptG family permease [Treponema sp.]|nr:LptF/LptG family permease [Treponema sp.]
MTAEDITQKFKSFIAIVFQVVIKFIGKIKSAAEHIINVLKPFVDKIVNILEPIVNKAIIFLKPIINIIIKKIKPFFTVIKSIFAPLWHWIKYKSKLSVILAPDEMESKRLTSPTLFRYVLSEMLFSFLICFLFFFFIFFVNQILLMAKEVLTKRVPFNQVALLILYSLPTVIAMSAPFASLVGTLMTVGRLTSDNEILVLLSSGLSYKIIFLPAITLGIVISLLSFFTNDVLLPAGTVQFNKLWRKILVSTPALELQANSVKRFKDTVIVTEGVSGNVIENILIIDKTDDGERRIIMAKTAELRDAGREGLSLDLEKAFIHSSKEVAREDYDYASSDLLQYWVSNEDIIPNPSVSPREMSSRDVSSQIKTRKEELDKRINDRKIRGNNSAFALEKILRTGPSSEDWNKRTGNAANSTREFAAIDVIKKDRNLTIFVIELYRKFSVPFGAFCFVFLAVSLGLMAKKSGQTVGFIFGNIIAVLYWSMLFIGQTMGLRLGTPPFWSMWLPNILSLLIGIILAIIRVRK